MHDRIVVFGGVDNSLECERIERGEAEKILITECKDDVIVAIWGAQAYYVDYKDVG